jgi:hypothetical protein
MKSVLFAAAVLVALSLTGRSVLAQEDAPPAPVVTQEASPSDVAPAVEAPAADAPAAEAPATEAPAAQEATSEGPAITVDGETNATEGTAGCAGAGCGSGCGSCSGSCSGCASACASSCSTSCAPKQRCRPQIKINLRRRGRCCR